MCAACVLPVQCVLLSIVYNLLHVCCMCVACVLNYITFVLGQSGLDLMHTVELGLWVHLLNCIAWTYDCTLKKYSILPHAKVTAVWDKLEKRAYIVGRTYSDDSMLNLNWYKANYLRFLLYERLDPEKNKAKKVQAWEHHLLMNVICLLVCKLPCVCCRVLCVCCCRVLCVLLCTVCVHVLLCALCATVC